MTRPLLACCAALLAASCGGKSGTISLRIVTSPADDPFADAREVRVTVGGQTTQTAPVNMGRFDLTFDQKPNDKDAQPILVEALDASGGVVAYGQTLPVSLAPADQGPYAVWVGRPGRMQPAAASMTIMNAAGQPESVGRAEMAVAPIPGLGILYAGGRGPGGQVLKATGVYDIFTHSFIETTGLNQPRAGAVGVGVGQIRGAVYGGSTENGFGSPASPLGSTELFDPTAGLGLWAPIQGDPVDARAFATAVALPSGTVLVSGGADGAGQALASALLITTDASPRVTVVANAMSAARRGHAMAPAKFPDGEGAIVFGGAAGGPPAERFVGSSFAPYDVGAVPSRTGHTATALPDGRVVILGGRDAAGVLRSGLVISPALPPQVVALDEVLAAPREDHTATLVGNDLLVCGGADAAGALVGTCELLDGVSLVLKETVMLGTPRRSHSAATLGNGLVVVAGGFGEGGAPLPSIEIYTPRR